jgi:hypothetical protein
MSASNKRSGGKLPTSVKEKSLSSVVFQQSTLTPRDNSINNNNNDNDNDNNDTTYSHTVRTRSMNSSSTSSHNSNNDSNTIDKDDNKESTYIKSLITELVKMKTDFASAITQLHEAKAEIKTTLTAVHNNNTSSNINSNNSLDYDTTVTSTSKNNNTHQQTNSSNDNSDDNNNNKENNDNNQSLLPQLNQVISSPVQIKTEPFTLNTQTKVNQPEPYSNERDNSIEKWIYDISNYFEITNLNHEKRILYASTYLKGDAELWCRSKRLNNEFNTWEDFINQIRQRFIQPNKVKRLMNTFDNIKQVHSVSAYVNTFQKYAIELRSKYSEEVMIHKFIRNLNNQIGSQMDLVKGGFSSLDEAIAQALEFESSAQLRNSTYLTPIHKSNHYNNNHNNNNNYSKSVGKYSNSVNKFNNNKLNPANINNTEYDNNSSSETEFIRSSFTSDYDSGSNDDSQSTSSHQSSSSLASAQVNRVNLSFKEREQLMKEGKCFKCKAYGHIIRNCQSKNVNAQMN